MKKACFSLFVDNCYLVNKIIDKWYIVIDNIITCTQNNSFSSMVVDKLFYPGLKYRTPFENYQHNYRQTYSLKVKNRITLQNYQ